MFIGAKLKSNNYAYKTLSVLYVLLCRHNVTNIACSDLYKSFTGWSAETHISGFMKNGTSKFWNLAEYQNPPTCTGPLQRPIGSLIGSPIRKSIAPTIWDVIPDGPPMNFCHYRRLDNINSHILVNILSQLAEKWLKYKEIE